MSKTIRLLPRAATVLLMPMLVLVLVLFSVGFVSARPTCKDDPDYRWKCKRQTCEWLGNQSEEKREKLCNKTKTKKKKKQEWRQPPSEGCPETCGSCGIETEPPAACPAWKPRSGGACSPEQEGIDCDYDFRWSGCVAEDLRCLPFAFLSCRLGQWFEAVVDPPFCREPPPPDLPVLETCDPNSFCPPVPPEAGTKCRFSGTSEEDRLAGCPYNHVFLGCTFATGMLCTPIDYFYCDAEDGFWQRTSVMPVPCPCEIDPGFPRFGTCSPCPSVEPAGICPPEEPPSGTGCSGHYEANGDAPLDCYYDFLYRGCTTEGLTCQPGVVYTCTGEETQTPVWRKAPISYPPDCCAE